MRILTNKHGLPKPIMNALKNDKYVKRGNISVTSLIDAPRIVIGRKFFKYEEDMADMLWSLFGTAMHKVVELGCEKDMDYLNELQLEYTLVIDGVEYVLTGTTDLYNKESKRLSDLKNTSVWKYMKGVKQDDDWVKQTNVYAALLRNQTKLEVESISIIAVFRDFSSMKASLEKDYPKCQVTEIMLPVFSQEKMLNYIKQRMELHFREERNFYLNESDFENLSDKLELLPKCTDKEKWKSETVLKVKKPGATRALKNFTIKTDKDKEECIKYFNEKLSAGENVGIEEVKGESRRCKEYCPLRYYCKDAIAEFPEIASQSDNFISKMGAVTLNNDDISTIEIEDDF